MSFSTRIPARREGAAVILVGVLAGAGIVVAGQSYYRDTAQRLRSQAEHQLSAVAELKVTGLMHWRAERLFDAGVLVRNRSFSALVRRVLDRPADAAALPLLKEWLGKYLDRQMYDQIRLVDVRGVTRLSLPSGRPEMTSVVAQSVSTALRTGRVAFQDFYRSDNDHRVYLATLVPIAGESESSPPLGVLVMRVDPHVYLFPFIMHWPTPSATAETLLVRREGPDALYLNALRFRPDAALTLRVPLGRTDIAAVQATLGREGVVDAVDYRGAPVVAALRAIPDSPWAIVARVDAAEVDAPLLERFWQVVAIVGAWLMAAGAGVVLVWRHRTHRALAAQAAAALELQESESRFRTAAETSNDVVYEWDLRQGVQWWGRIDDLLGFETGGAPRTIDGWAALVHPEDVDRMTAAIQAHLNGGAPYAVTYRIRRKDGTYRWWSSRGAAQRESDGTAIRWIGTITDITDARRAEEGLKGSEERFRRAVVDSPFPILIHAEDGTILEASASWSEITGYSREELATVGDWTEKAYGERKAIVQADIDRLYALDHRVAEGDYVVRTSFGTTRTWEFSSAPLGPLPDGRRVVISMAMDVTERRAAEHAVRQLNAELDQRVKDRTAELEAFSYSVSHDLRAPLRAISGYGRMLSEECGDRIGHEGQRLLGVISSETRRMGQLIDDLLAFSRLGRQSMGSSIIDMTALASASFDELAAREPARSLRLNLSPLAPASGDSAMLRVVWNNLISNAIKFTQPRDPGVIDIGSRQQGDDTVYCVKDNGVGFDMTYADKLFGIFQRLHSRDEFEGTGVGLALIQRVVHRHGGRVWAEGAVDNGAAFYFSLPNGRDSR